MEVGWTVGHVTRQNLIDEGTKLGFSVKERERVEEYLIMFIGHKCRLRNATIVSNQINTQVIFMLIENAQKSLT